MIVNNYIALITKGLGRYPAQVLGNESLDPFLELTTATPWQTPWQSNHSSRHHPVAHSSRSKEHLRNAHASACEWVQARCPSHTPCIAQR